MTPYAWPLHISGQLAATLGARECGFDPASEFDRKRVSARLLRETGFPRPHQRESSARRSNHLEHRHGRENHRRDDWGDLRIPAHRKREPDRQAGPSLQCETQEPAHAGSRPRRVAASRAPANLPDARPTMYTTPRAPIAGIRITSSSAPAMTENMA